MSTMRPKSTQDLATGLMFLLVGLAGLIIGWNYPLGSAQRPDTGVLPLILSWCLIATGGIITVKSFIFDGEALDLKDWAWRPVILIGLATVAFALLVDTMGLFVAMAVSMTLAALGTDETRWDEYVLFAFTMIFIGVAMFIAALGMPIKVWPTFIERMI
jgi:putative tricarboxylic transport membrane protein